MKYLFVLIITSLANVAQAETSSMFVNSTDGRTYITSGGSIFTTNGNVLTPIGGGYYYNRATRSYVNISIPARPSMSTAGSWQGSPSVVYVPGGMPKCPTNLICEGDVVEVTAGKFEGFQAQVESIDAESDEMVVTIEVFGRATQIDVLRRDVIKVNL